MGKAMPWVGLVLLVVLAGLMQNGAGDVAARRVLRGASTSHRTRGRGRMVLQQEVLARLLAASPRGFAHNNGGNSSQMVSVARLDLRSVDGLVPRCAWQMFATATTFPLAFPDVGSVYQVMIFRNLTTWRHLRISSSFPLLRYWSLQTYDAMGMAVASSADFSIQPKTGANPYAYRAVHDESAATADPPGRFEVFITLTGDVAGLGPNQLAAFQNKSEASQCDDHKAEPGGCMGVVFFRLYHDPSLDDYDGFNASTYRTPFDAWGQVETPRVHLGNDTHGWDLEVPVCRSEVVRRFTSATSERQSRRFSNVKINTSVTSNQQDNFLLPVADLGTLYGNLDATYTIATALYPPADPHGPLFLLARITGHLPLTPTGLMQGPRYVDVSREWEVRYVSYSVVNMEGGKTTLSGLTDTDIERFYTQRWGNESWGSRAFEIVAGPNASLARHCGLYDEQASLFLSTSTPPGLSYGPSSPSFPELPPHLGFVRREILPSPLRPQDQWSAYSPEQTSRSSAWAVQACRNASVAAMANANGTAEDDEAAATRLCYDSHWLARAMGANYPRITYYLCNATAPAQQRLRLLNASEVPLTG